MKICVRCGKEKPLSSFHKRAISKDGYKATCKVCILEWEKGYAAKKAEVNRVWYQKNKEADAAHRREYRANNREKVRAKDSRRRAREKSAPTYLISPKDWRWLFSQPCFYCGGRENMTIDHIIPLARGGSHGIGNLLPACHGCNASKGSKTQLEWKRARARQDLRAS